MADALHAPALAAPPAASPRRQATRRAVAREVAWALGTAVAAGTCAWLSVELTRTTSLVAALWVAHAVALVGWLTARRGRRADALQFAATVVAFFGSNIAVGNPPELVALFGACNVVEVTTALLLVRRATHKAPTLQTLGGLVRFVVAISVIAPLVSALGVAAYFAADGRDPLDPALTWYFGHAVGFVAAAPFLLALRTPETRALFGKTRAGETLAVVGLLLIVCLLAFRPEDRGLGFLLYPVMMFAAVRLRLFGAATATLLVALAGISQTVAVVQAGAVGGAAAAELIRKVQLYVGFAGLPALAVAVILNERDRYAAAAAARQAQAEAASQGKSKLLANVSHEVRTPLNAIIGFGDILLSQRLGPLTPSQDDLLRTMVRSAEQLDALAGDLTDVAKAEAGKLTVAPVRTDLRAVAADVVERLQPKARELNASISLEPGGPLDALADPMRVAQILTNLGTNALKYAGRHGPVIVRLVRSGHDRLRVEVVDQGPGVPAGRRDELFEPFNRLGKESGQIDGTGIGLAIARRLAELQNGRLDCDSTPGEGACFWLELPAA